MNSPSRVPPANPAHTYQTYSIASPLSTHTRAATCAEVECPHHQEGWTTMVDTGTALGVQQADYIRCMSGRKFVETTAGTMVAFEFHPGQRCFSADTHRVSLERPENYLVRGGDWRTSTGLIRKHTSAESWVDDFAAHQTKLDKAVNG